MRSSLRRTTVLTCAAVLLIAPSSPALAGDDGKSAVRIDNSSPIWQKQEKIDHVVQDIRTSGASDGISGVVVDPENGKVSLYWKGTPPAAVTDRIKAAAADGIEVAVRQAPYTEAELLAEADRISRKPLFNGHRTGQRMMKVSPRPDGTGLDVGLHGLPPEVAPHQARQVVPALDSAVPLNVTFTDQVSFTSRAIDTAPYWGGSYIYRRANGNACTSAFGTTGLNGAATYLLTAAHCGEGTWGSALYRDASGNVQQNVYGSTIPAGRATDLDAQLILTSAGAGAHIYWGTYTNPPAGDPGSNSGVPVRGSTTNSTGNAFCLSGSFSGTVCPGADIRITGTGITITYDPPSNGVARVTNLVQGSDVTGTRGIGIVGNGDSGGPVVSPTSDGGVLARGVISGMATGPEFEQPCQGWVPAGRVCSRVVFFADLQLSMARVGVRLNTSTG
ncbi:S1 family peptidase [Saccharothrix sp. S26]|uniref:S1 family peptidase n=1 Tax=Saccharothrix sp. S26 TaxID=2907215 RepID=UPI001F429611|nr:S1 family peptidase [Saccharothrix sp. S26]MCE6999275.1 S1 family peptidase [Saccharothrix sp. S26]